MAEWQTRVPAQLKVSEVYGTTIAIIKESFSTVMALCLLLMVPYALCQLLAYEGALLFLLTLIPQFVLGAWASAAFTKVAQRADEGATDKRSALEIITSVLPMTMTLVLIQIVVGILFGIGLVLLIVPGLIVIAVWAVAIQSAVIEGSKVERSLSRSAELTKGNRIQIVMIILVPFVLFGALFALSAYLEAKGPVLAGAISALSNIVAFPVFTILLTVVYCRLRDGEHPEAPVPSTVG